MKEELRELLEENVIITNIEESNQDYTEKEEHSTTFPAVRTEPAKRMMRCNPAPGAGEKPSPSQTAVALPVPKNHTKTK